MNKFTKTITLLVILMSHTYGSDNNPVETGKSGSRTRFSIVENTLYASIYHEMTSFDLTNPSEPEELSREYFDPIETIASAYPNIFIAYDRSMSVYNIESSQDLVHVSDFDYEISCNTITVERNHAFIALRNSGSCPGSKNELKVVDITNPKQPTLIKNYRLTAPFGLASNNNRLYICDKDELKIFDSTDVKKMSLINSTSVPECADIIYDDSTLIVTAQEGVSQFKILDDDTLEKISVIPRNL